MGTNATMDVELTDDATVWNNTPDDNYGTSGTISVNGYPTGEIRRAYIKISMPARPSIAVSREPIAVKIRLAIDTADPTNGLNIHARRVDKSALQVTESGVTWNKYDGVNNWTTPGGDLSEFVSAYVWIPAGSASHTWFEWDITEMNLDWEDTAWVCLKSPNESLSASIPMHFESCEGDAGYRPILRVIYEDESPEAITDLKIEANTADRTKATLTWSANKDSDFVSYKIRKSATSPVTYSSTLVATLTDQSATTYTEASANTENVVQYYAIFVEDANNTGANSVKSNEVWAIRPKVQSLYPDDSTPDLFQKVRFDGSGFSLPATPAPVSNTIVVIEFGQGTEPDKSSGTYMTTGTQGVYVVYHRFPYSSSQTPRAKLRNDLFGLESDWFDATIFYVAAALPIAKIRASNMLAATAEAITFYADESYCPAGNKSITTPNGYAWDWDYTGTFAADEYTTLPAATHSWGSAGTKTVALKVSDGTNWSVEVSMQVTVAAQTTVDLDTALVDGYDPLDYTDGRRASLLEGPESWEIVAGTQMPREAKIGGLAYTDTDVDGVPDDIETLNDIITNGKKVQLTLDGVARLGIINGPLQKHKEGGYVDKVAWSCAILLE